METDAVSIIPCGSGIAGLGCADLGSGKGIGSTDLGETVGATGVDASSPAPRLRDANRLAGGTLRPFRRGSEVSFALVSAGISCRRERACMKRTIRVWARVGPSDALAAGAESAFLPGLVVFGACLIVYSLSQQGSRWECWLAAALRERSQPIPRRLRLDRSSNPARSIYTGTHAEGPICAPHSRWNCKQ